MIECCRPIRELLFCLTEENIRDESGCKIASVGQPLLGVTCVWQWGGRFRNKSHFESFDYLQETFCGVILFLPGKVAVYLGEYFQQC
ncbi:hypothetical protein FR483_n133R [Paramecium bursaria Chlorella virus FR483]|uniref:Uncharacterized protein n133R n=1 Tax=Paramecium bursaria Chlorella virus FR483 TaxID=399781 RepID=A7J6I7_PBCVF|nr:hypothetical protein FR483_n133R [Paramecium bursaria Chlorella virus FR483]ABT15418.1 hypothetical protein FR483_n133R [Paramecium bursaria Chlorella virus FR483]